METQPEIEERTGENWCHRAKEKGLQESGGSHRVESCHEVKRDED